MLISQLIQSFRRPAFWCYSSWLDVAVRYRKTKLGFVWLLLPTLMFIVVLGNVYSVLMGHSPEAYLPYLGVGYILWRFIIQVLTESVTTLRAHKAFMMDGRTCLTDFLLRVLTKASFYLCFAIVVVAAVIAWSPQVQLAGLLTLVVTLPLLLVNMFWLAVCVSLFGARFPDTQEFVGTVLIVGFLLTPILWHTERFPPDTLRGVAVRFNPAYHLIEVVRAPVLGNAPELLSVYVVAGMSVVGMLGAVYLYRRYARFVPLWV